MLVEFENISKMLELTKGKTIFVRLGVPWCIKVRKTALQQIAKSMQREQHAFRGVIDLVSNDGTTCQVTLKDGWEVLKPL